MITTIRSICLRSMCVYQVAIATNSNKEAKDIDDLDTRGANLNRGNDDFPIYVKATYTKEARKKEQKSLISNPRNQISKQYRKLKTKGKQKGEGKQEDQVDMSTIPPYVLLATSITKKVYIQVKKEEELLVTKNIRPSTYNINLNLFSQEDVKI